MWNKLTKQNYTLLYNVHENKLQVILKTLYIKSNGNLIHVNSCEKKIETNTILKSSKLLDQ